MLVHVLVVGLWLLFPVAALAQETKCTPDDGTRDDEFGTSVGFSGNYAIVGMPYDDMEESTITYWEVGAAYIFYRNQGGSGIWGQVAKLVASDWDGGDWFGYSVALSGDNALVGAFLKDGGAAYIFSRNHGGPDNWGQVKKLSVATGDRFGMSVAIDSDYAIVGDWADDDNGLNSGSAYIFYRNQGGPDNWGQVKKIYASDGASRADFGVAVAISGDHALVGARYADGDTGAAYIFSRNQGGPDNWGQVKKLYRFGLAMFDCFGCAVAISGDYGVVGAYGENDTGSATVFNRNLGGPDGWGYERELIADDWSAGDAFGWSVAISGDYVLVGAVGDDDRGTSSGSAYVFKRDPPRDWGQLTKVSASDGAAMDKFGYAVAISGNDAIIGAPWDDDNLSRSGSAYVYDWTALLPVELTAFTAIGDGDAVLLQWQTASETNNAGFEVQHRASHTGAFAPVVFVKGKGTTTTPQHYQYRLEELAAGSHDFRLKQIDLDGAFTYSAEVSVDLNPTYYTLHEAYPNPFNPTTTISYDLPRLSEATLTIYDVLGRQVKELASGTRPAGTYDVTFDASGLPSGVYFYRLEAGDFVETKRMVVVK